MEAAINVASILLEAITAHAKMVTSFHRTTTRVTVRILLSEVLPYLRQAVHPSIYPSNHSSILKDILYINNTYFASNDIFDPRQSGFRYLHSTVTAPLDLTNQWCFNIGRGLVSGVVFLDMKKASDATTTSFY